MKSRVEEETNQLVHRVWFRSTSLAFLKTARGCRFSFFVTRRVLIGGSSQSRYALLCFHEIATIERVYENDLVVRR